MKGFAAIAAPLDALMKKDMVLHWTPECQEAFLKLEHQFTTALIIASPDFNVPFDISTFPVIAQLNCMLIAFYFCNNYYTVYNLGC